MPWSRKRKPQDDVSDERSEQKRPGVASASGSKRASNRVAAGRKRSIIPESSDVDNADATRGPSKRGGDDDEERVDSDVEEQHAKYISRNRVRESPPAVPDVKTSNLEVSEGIIASRTAAIKQFKDTTAKLAAARNSITTHVGSRTDARGPQTSSDDLKGQELSRRYNQVLNTRRIIGEHISQESAIDGKLVADTKVLREMLRSGYEMHSRAIDLGCAAAGDIGERLLGLDEEDAEDASSRLLDKDEPLIEASERWARALGNAMTKKSQEKARSADITWGTAAKNSCEAMLELLCVYPQVRPGTGGRT